MYIESKKICVKYTRYSKLNIPHIYTRTQTVFVFQCDSCELMFERSNSKMDSKRINNQYYHVCGNCDAKRFAQRKGVEKRKLWDISVDTDISIDRL